MTVHSLRDLRGRDVVDVSTAVCVGCALAHPATYYTGGYVVLSAHQHWRGGDCPGGARVEHRPGAVPPESAAQPEATPPPEPKQGRLEKPMSLHEARQYGAMLRRLCRLRVIAKDDVDRYVERIDRLVSPPDGPRGSAASRRSTDRAATPGTEGGA